MAIIERATVCIDCVKLQTINKSVDGLKCDRCGGRMVPCEIKIEVDTRAFKI
jgi:DNA-directed RNA polymerase subunit RPC12/RpoP